MPVGLRTCSSGRPSLVPGAASRALHAIVASQPPPSAMLCIAVRLIYCSTS